MSPPFAMPPMEARWNEPRPAIVAPCATSMGANLAVELAFDGASVGSSVVLEAEPPIVKLVMEATAYIRALAVLPADPEADASFAEWEKTLVRKKIPRRVLWSRK